MHALAGLARPPPTRLEVCCNGERLDVRDPGNETPETLPPKTRKDWIARYNLKEHIGNNDAVEKPG